MNPKIFDKKKLEANIQKIQENIGIIAKSVDRFPDGIKIIPATKYVNVEVIKALFELEMREVGESKVQELEAKAKELPDFNGWHFFGHLQSNKAKKALKYCKIIHSVDNLKIIQEISQIADEENYQDIKAFIELNTTDEKSKTGADVADAPYLVEEILKYPRIELIGFMTMGALGEPKNANKYFARLREIRDEMKEKFSIEIPELSMGMSGDYEQAIQEGATILRLGTILFDGIYDISK